MYYDFSKLELLARGGQADIYDLGDGRVLRLIRQQGAALVDMLRRERVAMEALEREGVGVPKVYDVGELDGRPAMVLQKLSGPSMLDEMSKAPLRSARYAGELAGLHARVASIAAPRELMDVKDQIRRAAAQSELLDELDKQFVDSLLAVLPDGSSVLHGDFHPGNILWDAGRYCLIDWPHAGRGSFLADVAHTCLLLADKPRLPGEDAIRFRLISAYARWFAGRYLTFVRQLCRWDEEEFGRWLAAQAAGRTVFGQPSERGTKARFVKACRRMQEAGVSPAKWYQRL